MQRAAASGVSGSGERLPYADKIQESFGAVYDLSGVHAHVGGAARDASDQMSAQAYAMGEHVAFRSHPDLHTAAHEAAHVVQQRRGVQLKGGVGQAGDRYEQHADAVADRVVRGESAEGLLDAMTGGSASSSAAPGAVQRDIKGGGNVPMGRFAIDMTNQENPGAKSGVSGTVSFTPNSRSPDTSSIRLTQVVKVLDNRTATPGDYTWTGAEADRNNVMTSDRFEAYTTQRGDTLRSISRARTQGHITPAEIYQANSSVLTSDRANAAIPEGTNLRIPTVQGGFFVDHSAADAQATPRTAPGDAEVSPYYRDYWPNASHSQDGSKQGRTIEEASLWDYPGSSFDARFSFETVARAEDVGIDYGTIHWDFNVESSKIENESFRVVRGTSETFRTAQAEFNDFYNNTHTVMRGDTLQSISQRYYGTPDRWNEIYEANKGIITDPTRLEPGWKLSIPGISV